MSSGPWILPARLSVPRAWTRPGNALPRRARNNAVDTTRARIRGYNLRRSSPLPHIQGHDGTGHPDGDDSRPRISRRNIAGARPHPHVLRDYGTIDPSGRGRPCSPRIGRVARAETRIERKANRPMVVGSLFHSVVSACGATAPWPRWSCRLRRRYPRHRPVRHHPSGWLPEESSRSRSVARRAESFS